MQYKHAQLILDLFSVSLDWRHRPNNNKYTTRLMTAMGAWIQQLSYSYSSFFSFLVGVSVICSYRTFPNLIIIYMCIPELFYNILLLCVNIRLFRSVKKPVIARSYWYPKLYWFLDTRRTEEHEMFNRFFENFPSPLQAITSWRK